MKPNKPFLSASIFLPVDNEIRNSNVNKCKEVDQNEEKGISVSPAVVWVGKYSR